VATAVSDTVSPGDSRVVRMSRRRAATARSVREGGASNVVNSDMGVVGRLTCH